MLTSQMKSKRIFLNNHCSKARLWSGAVTKNVILIMVLHWSHNASDHHQWNNYRNLHLRKLLTHRVLVLHICVSKLALYLFIWCQISAKPWSEKGRNIINWIVRNQIKVKGDCAWHTLMLVIICAKDGNDPSRTICAVQRTRQDVPYFSSFIAKSWLKGQYSQHTPLMLVIICA